MLGKMARLAAVGALAASAVIGSMAAPAAHAAATHAAGMRNASVQAEFQGVHLTAMQAKALRGAIASNPGLTREQTAKLVPAAAQAAPNVEGKGESRGPCGVADLWGDSFGHYRFGLTFNTEVVGTASVGGVTASTNGLFADQQPFGVSGSYVGNNLPGDEWYTLSTIGWGADATTLNGWALTTGAWFCTIDVTAPWEF
jgi:hypothetical protein